ncbi:PAS domain-containing sensor histidine kinase [Flavihumibacter sp. R14]|nr:PAS domain-containing sensor histidine kinase [Flavihumibacter soli]
MQPDENVFRSIVDASPFPVYLCTGDQMIIAVANQATLKAWGRDSSVIGKPFSEALPELETQPFRKLLEEVYTTGETYYSRNDRADLLIDGRLQTYYFKFTYQAMRNSEQDITGVLCFATDVTELERARQEVEQSQAMLYNMVKQAPVGICIIKSADLTVELVNDTFLELVGKTRPEVDLQHIWDAVPEAAEVYSPIMAETVSSGKPFHAVEHEIPLVRNGVDETVYIDFVYEPVRDYDGSINAVLVLAIDVSDKVMARRSIEDAEEWARLAIEAAEIGTFELDIATNGMRASSRFYHIFGFEQPVTRKVLQDAIHEDDRSSRIAALREAFDTGKLFYEARVTWNDNSVHWIKVEGRVTSDNAGNPVKILGTVLDITQFRHLQQQKDDFISVASHELKTPLTSMKSSMQVLSRILKADTPSSTALSFMDKANTSLAKMQHLVESLLNVSRMTADQMHLHKTHFKAADLVNECCEHLRAAGNYDLILTGDTGLEFYGDKDRLDQVLVNFVNNAVKYAVHSRKIVIHLSADAGTVKLSVRDFGNGIPAEKLPHLFERYYRVDSNGAQYSGLGLGLYISADIIKRHGGKIGVISKPGEGSTFWFTLPR